MPGRRCAGGSRKEEEDRLPGGGGTDCPAARQRPPYKDTQQRTGTGGARSGAVSQGASELGPDACE